MVCELVEDDVKFTSPVATNVEMLRYDVVADVALLVVLAAEEGSAMLQLVASTADIAPDVGMVTVLKTVTFTTVTPGGKIEVTGAAAGNRVLYEYPVATGGSIPVMYTILVD